MIFSELSQYFRVCPIREKQRTLLQPTSNPEHVINNHDAHEQQPKKLSSTASTPVLPVVECIVAIVIPHEINLQQVTRGEEYIPSRTAGTLVAPLIITGRDICDPSGASRIIHLSWRAFLAGCA